MPTQVTFDAQYTPELIAEATRSFRDYRFRRWGLMYVVACLVNAVGLALVLYFGAKGNAFGSVLYIAMTGAIACVVVIGPVWLAYQYLLEPARRAAWLERGLPPRLRMSMGPTTLWINTGARETAIPLNVVIEAKSLFLVVLSPFAFLIVPQSNLPLEALETLRGKARSSAA
jgi:hypothetical protein